MEFKLKKRKKLRVSINFIIAFISLLFVGIGFSISETFLNVNGIVSMNTNLWDVHFENVVVSSESVIATSAARINSSDSTLINFSVKLNEGQKYKFNVNVVNNGKINAKISLIDLGGLTNSQKKYLDYNATYSNGEIIKVGDILPANSSKTITISVNYIAGLSDSLYSTVNQSVELYYRISFVQQNGSAENDNWNIKFDNFKVLNDVVNSSSSKINLLDPSRINFNVKMSDPGQYYSFEVDIVNDSKYDAKVSDICLIGLSDSQKKYINFDVVYSDGKSINANDILKSGETKRILITLRYIDNLDISIYPDEKQSISLEYTMSFSQV